MNSAPADRLASAVFFIYALFVFSSSFSIALAQISLGVALLLFLVLIIRDRYQPFVQSLKWFYLAATAYVLWLVLASVAGPTPAESISSIREEWLFLAIPIGVWAFSKQRYRDRLITVLAVAVLILSVYGLVQYLTGANWFRSAPLSVIKTFGYRVQGNFSTRLTFAGYFGTAALFLGGYAAFPGDGVSARRRSLLLIISALAVLAVILTFSRGVILACAVAPVLLGLMLGRKYRLPVLAAIVALFLVVVLVPGVSQRFAGGTANDLNPEYEGSRLFIWNHTLDIIGEHPVLGVGPGNFAREYQSRLRPDIPSYRRLTHAHNDPLNVAAKAGIPGAIIFELMWLAALILFWRGYCDNTRPEADRRICLAALMGSVVFWMASLIEAAFADEEVRQLLMIIWAAGVSVWYKEKRAPAKDSASQ